MAQSLFQVGGNAGSALGPLLGRLPLLTKGTNRVSRVFVSGFLQIVLLAKHRHLDETSQTSYSATILHRSRESRRNARRTRARSLPTAKSRSLLHPVAFMFSKFFYRPADELLPFYLMGKFHVSLQSVSSTFSFFWRRRPPATIIGGPMATRSAANTSSGFPYSAFCLHFAPALLQSSFWTSVLSVIIGLILRPPFPPSSSRTGNSCPGDRAVSAVLRVCLWHGGIGAALLQTCRSHQPQFCYHLCSFLPTIGILTAFLPNLEPAS